MSAQGQQSGWPEWFSFDPAADTVTLFGIRYATVFFKTFGVQPAGYTFKIIERQNGTVSVQQERNELEAAAPALLSHLKTLLHNIVFDDEGDMDRDDFDKMIEAAQAEVAKVEGRS